MIQYPMKKIAIYRDRSFSLLIVAERQGPYLTGTLSGKNTKRQALISDQQTAWNTAQQQ
jgi:hypothetical protein